MLNITEELKTIYRNDLLPIVSENAPKNLKIHFPTLGLYVLTDQIVDDSFELNEKLCSEEDLIFGSCEASQIKFTVADVTEDLTGLEFTINQIVNDVHVMPLGKFKVDSCKKQDDLRFKDIIAYDAIKSTDINVADWYNSLFPVGNETYSLKAFRSSLLSHLGILEETQTLPNDDMIVEKTIDPTQISGREVLKATVELNGAFGHINRQGKFVRKILQPSYGLYPSETLYPSEDLYPVAETDTSYVQEDIIADTINKAMYESVRFEEYTVKEIDKLIIRAEEDDIGAIVGGDQKRVIDTQTGTSIASTKSDDAIAEITKIEGVTYQNVTVQGKNLIDYTKASNRYLTALNILADGEISASGKNSRCRFEFSLPITLKGKTVSARYTILEDTSVSTNIRLSGKKEDSSSKYFLPISNGGKVTIPTTATTVMFEFVMNNTATVLETDVVLRVKDIQLEEGSTATPYEPFTPNSPSPEYPSPITNANNFDIIASNGTESNKMSIPYELASDDTIEKGADGVTRRIQRKNTVVFDGSPDESWVLSSGSTGTVNRFAIGVNGLKKSSAMNILCTHFKANTGVEHGNITSYGDTTQYIACAMNKAAIPDVASFKLWLQSNPVTVQYELETPIYTITDLPSLTSYKGITNITTTANPQVNLTVDFYANPINTYIIEGNFLVFGKSAVELEQIARNAFGNMAKRPYRPYEAQSIGLPYVEVGDSLEIATDDVVVGYVLQRTLTGIQALRDEYTANGNEEREQNFGVNKEIIQLQGRTAILKRTVDEVSTTLTDLEADTESRFTQTAEQIELRVSKNGVVSAINQSAEEIKISASRINLEGYVTITNLETPGSVEIDGGNLKAGTVVADSVRADWVYAGTISGDKINGGTISGVTIVSTGSSGTTSIYNGGVTTDFIRGEAMSAGSIAVGANVNIYGLSGTVSATNGNFTNINGYTPVTAGNIGNHTAGHATTAGYAEESYHAERADIALVAGSVSGLSTGQITASNTGYGNIDFLGFDNAAGVNWAQANFAPIGSSDIRLKHSVLPMDDLPDELFYELKPYQFKYKTDTYGKGIFFGLIAQQVENAFQRYGLDPYNYDLIDLKDVKAYTDDGMYVTDKTHRIHYTNFIAWLIRVVQKQNERIAYLENTIS